VRWRCLARWGAVQKAGTTEAEPAYAIEKKGAKPRKRGKAVKETLMARSTRGFNGGGQRVSGARQRRVQGKGERGGADMWVLGERHMVLVHRPTNTRDP
jgi:hypothetical protein